jgi:hypothetical protein
MKPALAIVLIALPVMIVSLWLASGREVLTKPGKAVSVSVRDEVFGETFIQQKMVPGPILGYYVGLDMVILVAAGCLVLSVVAWWAFRRQASRRERESVT